MPTPNLAHTLVSACHKRRNIRSPRLTTRYGLHQKTSFVSIWPHSSAHSGDSSTQRQVSLASGRSLGVIGDVVLAALALIGQTNSATTLDLFLPPSGDRPSYWAMAERRDGPSWLRDDDEDDDEHASKMKCTEYIRPCHLGAVLLYPLTVRL